jgi:uncharacterized membrane protein YqjE
MDLRTLQSLQQAIPVLLRHLGAYLELAEQDMAATKAEAVARLRLIIVFSVGAFFTILMSCILVIALTWDTENRVFAILFMGCVFTALTAVSGLYIAQLRPAKPFGAVRREWRQDRELVNRLLMGGDADAGADRHEQPAPGY